MDLESLQSPALHSVMNTRQDSLGNARSCVVMGHDRVRPDGYIVARLDRLTWSEVYCVALDDLFDEGLRQLRRERGMRGQRAGCAVGASEREAGGETERGTQ